MAKKQRDDRQECSLEKVGSSMVSFSFVILFLITHKPRISKISNLKWFKDIFEAAVINLFWQTDNI